MTKVEIRHGGGYDPKLGRDHPDNFDPTLETCGMIKPHHPDCECETCKAGHDEKCKGLSVGLVTDSKVRVCADCAKGMESEGFTVTYDQKSGT